MIKALKLGVWFCFAVVAIIIVTIGILVKRGAVKLYRYGLDKY